MDRQYNKPPRYSSPNASQVIRYFNAVKLDNKNLAGVRLFRASQLRKSVEGGP